MVEIFGQHELAELAHDKSSVARMLQRFAGSTGPDPDYVSLQGKLRDNRTKLARAEKDRDDLETELADIPRLEQHVAQYTATDLPTRRKELKQLDSDEGVFTEASQRLAAVRGAVATLPEAEVIAALTAPLPNIETSSRKATLERASAAATKLHTKVTDLFVALAAALDEAEEEIASAKADWKEATDPQRDGHAEVLRKLVEDGHDPDKYLTTTKALDALKAKEQRRPGIATRIATLQAERTELLGQLAIIEKQTVRGAQPGDQASKYGDQRNRHRSTDCGARP